MRDGRKQIGIHAGAEWRAVADDYVEVSAQRIDQRLHAWPTEQLGRLAVAQSGTDDTQRSKRSRLDRITRRELISQTFGESGFTLDAKDAMQSAASHVAIDHQRAEAGHRETESEIGCDE